MTINYLEQIASRTINRTEESFSATRTFLVFNDDGNGVLSASGAINHSSGVHFADSHPEISSIFANGFTVTPVVDRRFTYTVVWNYAQPKAGEEPEDEDPTDGGDNTDIDPDGDGGDLDPPTDGEEEQDNDSDVGDDGVSEDEPDGDGDSEPRRFNGVSITTGLSLVDGFVAGATIPSGGTEVEDAITTGTVVHEGGEPVTVPVPTTEISLSETVFGAYFYLNDVQLKAGKRNSSAFLGFAVGSVIFKGMSVQRQEFDQWDVTYTFAWDAWSHMRQVPKRTDDGETDWTAGEPPTLDIYFKQPFPDSTSFSFAP